MKKNIFLIAGLAFASILIAAPIAYAVDYGLVATTDAAGLSKEGSIVTIIGNIIGNGLALISVLFFIMMVYGGVMWMTSRGKEETSKRALDVIFAAIIGIIIVLSAYAITTFIFKSVGVGGNTTSATTPGPTDKVTECASMCSQNNHCKTIKGTVAENMQSAERNNCFRVIPGACPSPCPTQ